jgi:hypothetical protein
MVVVTYFWLQMFPLNKLLEQPASIGPALLVAFMLYIVPILYLFRKITYDEDHFTFKQLFGSRTVTYNDIVKIYYKKSRSRNEDSSIFQSSVFVLSSGEEVKIDHNFVSGKNRGDMLLKHILTKNPSIALDVRMTQELEGKKNTHMLANRIGLFIVAHIFLFFAFSVIK